MNGKIIIPLGMLMGKGIIREIPNPRKVEVNPIEKYWSLKNTCRKVSWKDVSRMTMVGGTYGTFLQQGDDMQWSPSSGEHGKGVSSASPRGSYRGGGLVVFPWGKGELLGLVSYTETGCDVVGPVGGGMAPWSCIPTMAILVQKLNRKLVHVSIGLVFMLCWPLFSSGLQGAVLAALLFGINVINMLLLGLGIWKNEATVKSMSRFGDYRELLKGPFYYALAITLACVIYWRTSPIAIATICNLCAGDGFADIVGRRFGSQKVPYNKNKSIAGSIAMATAGFIASIAFMHYFALFGYVQESWEMALGFLVVSLVAALVESHPLTTDVDDNLAVPLASVLVGSFVF